MNDQKYMDAYDHDISKRRADFIHKVAQVRHLMQELGHDAVVLSLVANFAWITSGARNYVFMATESGAGSIYVDSTRIIVLTNEIEGHKLVHEEMRGLEQDVTLVTDPWYAQRSHLDVALELANSDKVVVDATNGLLAGRLAELRSTLTLYEMEVFRKLGKDCGEIIGEVARAVRPNMTEWDIAAHLSAKMWARAITPVVMLVAADERVDTIRHPLPTKKRVKNKAMLVICGQRAGLIASTTRLVYITINSNVGIPDDLVKRHNAATYVDAALIANTSTAGVKAGEMLKIAQDAYAAMGYEGEWQFHHQGGCAAYKSREWVANPSINRVTGLNQAYAWNPSIAGTKSEDTVLCYANTQGTPVVEVITASPDWPMIEHTIGEITIARPNILHLQF
ncbi:putative creatinase/aminopeptidase [Plasmopara halstedii]